MTCSKDYEDAKKAVEKAKEKSDVPSSVTPKFLGNPRAEAQRNKEERLRQFGGSGGVYGCDGSSGASSSSSNFQWYYHPKTTFEDVEKQNAMRYEGRLQDKYVTSALEPSKPDYEKEQRMMRQIDKWRQRNNS